MKELYTIKQGTKESVKHFDTHIGYAKMRPSHSLPTCPCHGAGRRNQEDLLS